MRRLHMASGVVGVIVFVITGQLMRHHHPPVATLDPVSRLMFRSRHIYILGNSLTHLMLGCYLRPLNGWRHVSQTIGSSLLVTSLALLAMAFAAETESGFHSEMRWSAFGLYLLFAGALAHVVAVIGKTPAYDTVSR